MQFHSFADCPKNPLGGTQPVQYTILQAVRVPGQLLQSLVHSFRGRADQIVGEINPDTLNDRPVSVLRGGVNPVRTRPCACLVGACPGIESQGAI